MAREGSARDGMDRPEVGKGGQKSTKRSPENLVKEVGVYLADNYVIKLKTNQ